MPNSGLQLLAEVELWDPKAAQARGDSSAVGGCKSPALLVELTSDAGPGFPSLRRLGCTGNRW
ncbi:MAG: hypothetical protein L0228_18340 [Planctomycetes bacterium]|nr:hypothetical protein [Planctomycetota bacterium]